MPPSGRLRFPHSLRMKSAADFRRVYREGTRVRGDLLTVALLPNGLDHPRLGLSVGKRCWKSAVRRNRVRRVFREAFRLRQHDLPAGFDLVLIPAAPALDPALEATADELVRLARKAAERYRTKQEERAAKS